MNPTTSIPPLPPPPPPPPPHPHLSSSSCPHHPNEHFTTFCPSCLLERLTTLNPSSSTNPSSSRRNSTSTSSAAAAIKSLFSKPPKSTTTTTTTTTFFPELRRSKSFSASKNDAVRHSFEPQRKSCDVRVSAGASSSSFSRTHHRYLVAKEEEKISGESEEFEDCEIGESNVDGIEGIQIHQPRISCSEIVEEEEANNDYITLKPMKEFLDLDSQSKKTSTGGMKEIAGSFRSTASVFSKKWHNWRRKQKVKKEKNGENSGTFVVEKGLERRCRDRDRDRDSRSEVVDYGFGRRSCDIDPGRVSLDDPRCSFEQPRASWDGHLIGRSFPKMHLMDSLVEDAPVVHILQAEKEILVEDHEIIEDDNVPGGTAQTRNYYADSSTRRRKSLDRSSSIRKTAASVVAEIDEMRAVFSDKVSPGTMSHSHGTKALVGEGVLKESNSNSLSNDCSETFELGCSRDNASMIGNEERKGMKKSSWSWKLWAFINKRSGWRKDDDVRYSKANGVERSLSESCQGLRSNGNAELRGSLNRKIFRSNSSVSWRNSPNFEAAFGSVNRQEIDTNDLGRKRRDDFVLERNRSGRYSPNNINNGLLRFYLTPMRSSQGVGPGKNRLNSSQSLARSILQLY